MQGVQIINVVRGEVISEIATDPITYSVFFSPDGQHIVTGHGTPGHGPSAAGYITVTNVSSGISPVEFQRVRNRVTQVQWQPDGNSIAGLNIGELGEVVIWDATTGMVINRISQMEEGEDEFGFTYLVGHISTFVWTRSGGQIVIAEGLKLAMFDGETYVSLAETDYSLVIEDLALNPQENIIAVATGYNRQIKLLSALTLEIIQVIETELNVDYLTWSPSGNQIIYGSGTQGRDVIIYSPPPPAPPLR